MLCCALLLPLPFSGVLFLTISHIPRALVTVAMESGKRIAERLASPGEIRRAKAFAEPIRRCERSLSGRDPGPEQATSAYAAIQATFHHCRPGRRGQFSPFQG